MDRRERDAAKVAKKHGFKLYRKTKHMIWRNDAGAQVVCPLTSSDRRMLRHFEAQLKKANQGL